MTEGSATPLPVELARLLDDDAAARRVFGSLSPSHRREHIRYIEEAKRPATRQRRAERTVEFLRG